MNPERKEIPESGLAARTPLKRQRKTAAFRLGFEPEHIPILVGAVASSSRWAIHTAGAGKFFLTVEIEQKKGDAR